jgi:phage shock protein C
MAGERRLTRSTDRHVAGVCAGIAEYFGWHAGHVRILWILGTVFSAGIGGIVLYVLLSFVMPPPPTQRKKFRLEDFRVQ